METIKNGKLNIFSTRAFFILCILTTGLMYICGIVNCTSSQVMTFFVLLIFAIIALYLCYLLIQNKEKITDKTLLITGAACIFLMLAAQIITTAFIAVIPSWDFGIVYNCARDYVVDGYIHEYAYLGRFPNNTGLFVLEAGFFKLFHTLGFEISPYLGVALNIILTDCAIVFMALFCKNVFGNARTLIYMILSTLFFPYILYASIFYSDTMSMIFITLPLYLFSQYLKQDSSVKKALLALSIGLLLAFGFKVKGTVFILLIAMLIYAVFNFGIKRLAAFALALLISFFALSSGFEYAVREADIIREDEMIHRFPTEYWIYMGLKDAGSFNDEDFSYILERPDYETKKAAARAGISERLKTMGFTGLIKHFWEKAAFTYRDGLYFVHSLLSREQPNDNLLTDIFVVDAKYNRTLQIFTSAYHHLILLLLIAGMLMGLKGRGISCSVMLYISLFGLSIFLLIWETRSRYVLNFTPIMLLLAGDSLMHIAEKIKKQVQK